MKMKIELNDIRNAGPQNDPAFNEAVSKIESLVGVAMMAICESAVCIESRLLAGSLPDYIARPYHEASIGLRDSVFEFNRQVSLGAINKIIEE